MSNTPLSSNVPSSNADKDFEDIRAGMGEASNDDIDRRARIEYLRNLTGNKRPKKSRKKAWLICLVIVLVLAIGTAVYWFIIRPNQTSQADKKTSTEQPKKDTEAENQVAVVPTKHYDSPAFNLGFDYPENWKVIDNNDGRLLVVSPASKFSTKNGTKQLQVYFMVQTKQPTLPGFAAGNGIATRISEKIAYVKPTPNQRAQTYMTFVSYAGSATQGIDTVFVTGDLGYQKDQAVPQVDIVQGDPLVSISFATCNEDKVCAADPSKAHAAIADSNWNADNRIIQSAKTILTSLTIN